MQDEEKKIELYTYYRSSASFRVRIALNLKKLDAQYHYVDLSDSKQFSKRFTKMNSQNLVPVLIDDNRIITQSTAIIEYLEEAYPVISLLSEDIILRAEIRSFSQAIACEIQPFGNIRPLHYLKDRYNLNNDNLLDWHQHWVHIGLTSLENKLSVKVNSTLYSLTNTPSIAEVYLIPQMLNAKRLGMDISHYKHLYRIYNQCLQLPAFSNAMPSNQGDMCNV